MKTPGPAASASRKVALAAEAALQAGLSAGRGLRAAVAGLGRSYSTKDLSGRRCHCSPSLPLHFVHSEALREACDFVIDEGSNVTCGRRPSLGMERVGVLASGLGQGAAVHVKADRLAAFRKHVLWRIRRPIVLVTGDSDQGGVAANHDLLEHPMIAHWFAQNCDLGGRHPRLTRVPIGLDNPVFTTLDKRIGFALAMAMRRMPLDATLRRNDMGDQALLAEVRAELPPTRLRPPRALCTFHQNSRLLAPDIGRFPERAEAARLLRALPCCHFPARRLAQRDCWRLHGAFAFEVSPRGNGLDCFRTWEALALGTIPIVLRSTLDPLFEDEELPVALVGDWGELDERALTRWHAEFAPRFTEDLVARLLAPYWVAKIRRAADRLKPSAP